MTQLSSVDPDFQRNENATCSAMRITGVRERCACDQISFLAYII